MLCRFSLVLTLALPLCAQEAVRLPQPGRATAASLDERPSACGRLDHDLLDPAYFGIDWAQFKETRVVDYWWAKPGFSLKGHTLKVTWEDPQLLVPQDDKLDLKVLNQMNKFLPQNLSSSLASSLWPAAKVSSTEGDLIFTGRIVMINVRSGYWSRSVDILTFDMKIIDGATKETLVAAHHRLVPWRNTVFAKGKDLELRIPTFTMEFSEFCRTNLTDLNEKVAAK